MASKSKVTRACVQRCQPSVRSEVFFEFYFGDDEKKIWGDILSPISIETLKES